MYTQKWFIGYSTTSVVGQLPTTFSFVYSEIMTLKIILSIGSIVFVIFSCYLPFRYRRFREILMLLSILLWSAALTMQRV